MKTEDNRKQDVNICLWHTQEQEHQEQEQEQQEYLQESDRYNTPVLISCAKNGVGMGLHSTPLEMGVAEGLCMQTPVAHNPLKSAVIKGLPLGKENMKSIEPIRMQ